MRKLIFKILLEVFSLSFVLIIASNYFVRMKIVENNFVSRSENVFKQIETTLILNDEQLDIYYQLFTKQTLSKAKEAAKLLELEPDAINSVDKLKEIADFLQVDEPFLGIKGGDTAYSLRAEFICSKKIEDCLVGGSSGLFHGSLCFSVTRCEFVDCHIVRRDLIKQIALDLMLQRAQARTGFLPLRS